MTEPLRIYILDDEVKMGRILSRVLEREGHTVRSGGDPEAALAELAAGSFDLLLTDLRMPKMNGVEVMRRARETAPDMDVVMMTAYASAETAVEAMKSGATDYLIKPFHNDELVLLVAGIAEKRGLRQENDALKRTLAEPPAGSSEIVAASEAMAGVLRRVAKVAASDVSVLLQGESGTGKEVLASRIHASGPRRARPFVRVNCGALPETLLESELFGHVRGAFTGAIETRKGLFQAADGGTIFLDEIGEVSQPLQVKLLRVLQNGEFQRVGDPATFHVDVRVIAATNRSLERMIEGGAFRSDLYYRLNVVPILIPPLRERRDDVAPLIDHFLGRLRTRDRRTLRVSPEAFALLSRYDWPGNIRELENAIEHASVLCEGDSIRPEDLPTAVINADPPRDPVRGAAERGGDTALSAAGTGAGHRAAPPTLEDVEKRALLDALRSTGFNHTRAAAKLGITRRTLGYRIDKYDLPRRIDDDAPAKGSGENGAEHEINT